MTRAHRATSPCSMDKDGTRRADRDDRPGGRTGVWCRAPRGGGGCPHRRTGRTTASCRAVRLLVAGCATGPATRRTAPGGVGGIRRRRTRRARSPSSSPNSPRTPCSTAACPDGTSASGSLSTRRRAWSASRSRTRPPRNGPQRPWLRRPLRASRAEGCSWWTLWPCAGVRRRVTHWARRCGRKFLSLLQLALNRSKLR
jgi:hypothetical protein